MSIVYPKAIKLLMVRYLQNPVQMIYSHGWCQKISWGSRKM